MNKKATAKNNKDNQLFLYHNEFVQPYNEVFYLFYQYLDYINKLIFHKLLILFYLID